MSRDVWVHYVEVPLEGGWAGPIRLEEGDSLGRVEWAGRRLIVQINSERPPPKELVASPPADAAVRPHRRFRRKRNER